MSLSYKNIGSLLIAVSLSATATAELQAADYKMIKPRMEVRGQIRDDGLRKKGKEFYASEKEFTALWKAWRKGEPPKVDFSTELVLTATCGGPNTPSVGVSLMKDGNLRWGAACTRVGGPGFGYWIGIVPREGVKKLNGKDVPPPTDKPAAK